MLGARIDKRLKAIKLNIFDAAIQAGLDEHFLYDIRRGMEKEVSESEFEKMAFVLKCSVGYLKGETDVIGGTYAGGNVEPSEADDNSGDGEPTGVSVPQGMKARVFSRLNDLQISQFEAAERTGKHHNFIYDFLVGRKQDFKGDGLERVANALECSVDYLTGASDEIRDPEKPDPLLGLSFSRFEMAFGGGVETEAYKRLSYPDGDFRRVNLAPSPSFKPQEQIAYLVRGNGLSSRGIVDGMLLTCVRAEHAYSTIHSGSILVVQSSEFDGAGGELFARGLVYDAGASVLRCCVTSGDIIEISPSEDRKLPLRVVAVALEATLSLGDAWSLT